jgi:hypothetical protein
VRARDEDATQRGKSREVHVFEKRSVGDEKNGAGIFQLIANLALAVGGIEERGDASGQRGGMIGDGEFPGVRRKIAITSPGTSPAEIRPRARDSTRLPYSAKVKRRSQDVSIRAVLPAFFGSFGGQHRGRNREEL